MANCDVTFMFDSEERSRVRERIEKSTGVTNKLRIEDMDENSSEEMRAPIIGYEVIEQRQRFTVYKIQVIYEGKSWFVFRRYTDFVRLNESLQDEYPLFRFRLPGKRWFKDNYDPDFIDERARKLQLFISSVLNHSDISKSSKALKEFFCIDDPPGPYDSIEESRAYCQLLEDQLEEAKQKISELTSELSATKSQLAQARIQQEALVSALRLERQSKTNRGRRYEEECDGSLPDDNFQKTSEQQIGRDRYHQETKTWDGETQRFQRWSENLKISAHLDSTERLKPTAVKPRGHSNEDAQLKARLHHNVESPVARNLDTVSSTLLHNVEEPQSPLTEVAEGRLITSTPIDKERVGFTPLAFSKVNNDKAKHACTTAGVVEDESIEKDSTLQGSEVSLQSDKDENNTQQNDLHRTDTEQCDRHALKKEKEQRVRNFKRDSGIIVDQSPTPNT